MIPGPDRYDTGQDMLDRALQAKSILGGKIGLKFAKGQDKDYDDSRPGP